MVDILKGAISDLEGSYAVNPISMSEQLLKNPYHGGIITIPYSESFDFQKGNSESVMTKSIPFHMGSNFSFRLNNTWSTMVPEGVTDFLDNISNLYNFTQKENNQISWQSQMMQTAVWKKSDKPQFKIDTTFISTSRSINPTKIITALAAGALPGTDSELGEKIVARINSVAEQAAKIFHQEPKKLDKNMEAAIRKMGMVAPFGYNPTWENGGELKNKCSISIGKWFRATNLIISSIDNIEFSKEVVAPYLGDDSVKRKVEGPTLYDNDNGYPLYAKCSITFEPYRPISAKEFSEYFINSSGIKLNIGL